MQNKQAKQYMLRINSSEEVGFNFGIRDLNLYLQSLYSRLIVYL